MWATSELTTNDSTVKEVKNMTKVGPQKAVKFLRSDAWSMLLRGYDGALCLKVFDQTRK